MSRGCKPLSLHPKPNSDETTAGDAIRNVARNKTRHITP